MPRLLVFSFVCSLFASLADAHEFWIEPTEYQVESDGELVAHLRNGEAFEGSALAYFQNRSQRFDIIWPESMVGVESRMGDIPALNTVALEDGLVLVVHVTTPSRLTYKEWEKFLAFAEHKDFGDIEARHAARSLPESGFAESYTRHAKALIAVGSGTGSDKETGMATEFVARTNPYTDDLSSGFTAQLYYNGDVRKDAQVEVFAKSPGGDVEITLLRTDADGLVRMPVKAGHEYLLDAVVLRPAQDGSDAAWETLWASLTFSTP